MLDLLSSTPYPPAAGWICLFLSFILLLLSVANFIHSFRYYRTDRLNHEPLNERISPLLFYGSLLAHLTVFLVPFVYSAIYREDLWRIKGLVVLLLIINTIYWTASACELITTRSEPKTPFHVPCFHAVYLLALLVPVLLSTTSLFPGM